MKIADIKVDYIDHCGTDLSTVNSARVSFQKESDWETDPFECSCGRNYACTPSCGEFWEDNARLSVGDTKLINYLAKHKHKSPFNHSFISVRVKAPIFVARQMVKHRFMPWNEISRRYVDNEPEFYVPSTLRAKAENVKQGSSQESVSGSMFITNIGDGDVMGDVSDAVTYSTTDALRIYQGLLDKGVCAEQARMVLPQNTMTEWFWSGTLGAFADMLVLRLSPYTQAETRVVAEQIRDIVQPLFPVSLKALLDNA
jgi:thymidylate synthase (FAD)